MAMDFVFSSLVQSNTNVGCTGGTTTGLVNSFRNPWVVGTPGVGGIGVSLFTLNASMTNRVVGFYRLAIPSNAIWSAGTWTWRMEITTADMLVTITSVYICRLNSSLVNQATIGSATGLSVSCGSLGIISGNITGIAQSPSAGDLVGVFFIASNSSSMSAATIYNGDAAWVTSPFSLPTRQPFPTSIGHPFIM